VSNVVLSYRRPIIIGVYLLLWVLSFVGAFMLRFEFAVPASYLQSLWVWLPVLLVLRIAGYGYFGMFRGMWRYTSGHDLVSLAKAATASSALFVLFIAFSGYRNFPRSVLITDWIGNIVLIGGLRFMVRVLRELSARVPGEGERRKVLIVGAGDAGEMLLREIKRSLAARYEPVGFVDDDPHKQDEHIHGVPVLGPLTRVGELVQRHEVKEVIIAIPSATGQQMRRIVELCGRSGAEIRTIPGVDSLIDGRVTLSQVRSVAIEDLLGREPVVLDNEAISGEVRGARVLVTGAGGSIGAELCRQVCRFKPARLVLVERAENNLFHIHRELTARFPDVAVVPVIADICDAARMEAVFEAHRPTQVFHAAAYKHVPMMEWNPNEAVKNNVFGTRTLADLADAHGVQRFVMISTDKAVNPTSVMGATKRVAEIYIQALSQRSKTRFVTVRFGNVLGSAGSVVPIFQEQIARGGPVTVTHPEMKRYFMTIPEACQLVLQAATMGEGGEIFVLDMGEPVKIVDLARDLIRLSGFRPGEDIEIRFTGIRPGEKLFEELTIKGENADRTRHPKIFVGRLKPHAWADVARGLDVLARLDDRASEAEVRRRLAEIVPEYTPVVPADGAPSWATEPAPPRGESTSQVVEVHRGRCAREGSFAPAGARRGLARLVGSTVVCLVPPQLLRGRSTIRSSGSWVLARRGVRLW
jgi:FlaA1/EpsC-like NDP-sugar epimerase